MIALINKLLDWFKALFWKEEMELTLVGLQYSGKTTFVNVIAVSLIRQLSVSIWLLPLLPCGGGGGGGGGEVSEPSVSHSLSMRGHTVRHQPSDVLMRHQSEYSCCHICTR